MTAAVPAATRGPAGFRQRTAYPHPLPDSNPMKSPPTSLPILVAAAFAVTPAAALDLLTDENPPFNYTEKGKLVGSATEIVLDMASRAGVPVKTEVLTWDRAYVRAQGEKGACLYSTARLEHRERIFLWVGPIATNLWAVYGKGDFAPPIRSLKDLAPYRIGTVQRDVTNDFLRDNGVSDVRPAREDAQNLSRLQLPHDHPDHIDLWITGFYTGPDLARAAKAPALKLVFIANEQPLYLACNPQMDRKVVKGLADALEAIKADGTQKRITADYEKRFAR